MTLRDQIRDIHARNFNKEFHEYRKGIIPAMLNDLAMKFFDDLETGTGGVMWFIGDSQDIRAVKHARKLMLTIEIRVDTPGVE